MSRELHADLVARFQADGPAVDEILDRVAWDWRARRAEQWFVAEAERLRALPRYMSDPRYLPAYEVP